jgi:hypothetical protein
MFLGQASVKVRSSVGYDGEMTRRKAASPAGFERSGILLEDDAYGYWNEIDMKINVNIKEK